MSATVSRLPKSCTTGSGEIVEVGEGHALAQLGQSLLGDLAVLDVLGVGEHVLGEQLAAGNLDVEGLFQAEHDGAESIDFLDIVFRLEKAFDIKIPRGELFPEDVLTDAEYVQDGKVTEQGLAELRKRMPFANLDDFAKNPVVQDFGNLLTVADMCRFIEGKVA